MQTPSSNPDFTVDQQLETLVRKLFPHCPKPTPCELSLVEDLKADSLDLIDFLLTLEDTFDIEIPDEDFSHILNLNSLKTYLQTRLVSS